MSDPFGFGKQFVVPSIPIGLIRQAINNSGGGGFTRLTATGTVDGANTTFTFTQKPTYIVSDGAWYRENSGWTYSGSTATMSVPPQTDIFGVA